MEQKTGVLFVDDNNLDLMVGERLVSVVPPHTPVKTFNNGRAFLEWIEGDNFDFWYSRIILLVDIHMSEINGIEIARKANDLLILKGIEPMIHLLSASVDKKEIDPIDSNSSIQGFIAKPLTKENITNLLNVNS